MRELWEYVNGHWPHWVKCCESNPGDRWYLAAYKHTPDTFDGTFEAIGHHFQNNPYKLGTDILVPHGKEVVEVPRTFEGIREYLQTHIIESIVFWKDDAPQCKIKRRDFGFA